MAPNLGEDRSAWLKSYYPAPPGFPLLHRARPSSAPPQIIEENELAQQMLSYVSLFLMSVIAFVFIVFMMLFFGKDLKALPMRIAGRSHTRTRTLHNLPALLCA